MAPGIHFCPCQHVGHVLTGVVLHATVHGAATGMMKNWNTNLLGTFQHDFHFKLQKLFVIFTYMTLHRVVYADHKEVDLFNTLAICFIVIVMFSWRSWTILLSVLNII